MVRRTEPPPAAKRVLEAIKVMHARGSVPTLGTLAKRLGKKSKSPVAEAIARLVRLRWLRRGKYRPGKSRALIVIA